MVAKVTSGSPMNPGNQEEKPSLSSSMKALNNSGVEVQNSKRVSGKNYNVKQAKVNLNGSNNSLNHSFKDKK